MTGRDDMVTLVAVGDVIPGGEYPEEGFDFTRSILRGADITFGQLERCITERGTRQLQGGFGFRCQPRASKVLSDAGFNIMSFASNHTMDWSDDGLLDTLDTLRDNNIAVIGAGKNIEEARQPVIIERKRTKVGFLAYCSVLPQRYDAKQDRAGVAPVRISTAYEQFDWQPGTPPRIITMADPDDLAAMVEDIKKLRPLVDVLVVSMHWGVHFVPAIIAMYQYEVGHTAIDAGADIIIGTHAHILKGIEVYKGKVIFFSLSNFRMDLFLDRLISSTPNSFSFYNWEVDPEYPTYAFPIDSKKSVLIKCNIANKRIQRVAFLPLWINKKAQPELLSRSDPRSDEVYQYMEWVCKEQRLNTKFSREGDEVVVLA